MAWTKKGCLVCGSSTRRRVYWEGCQPVPLCRPCRGMVVKSDLVRFKEIADICDQRCESCDCLMVAYRDSIGIRSACPSCDVDWLRRWAGMERLFLTISNIRHSKP